MRAEGFEPPRCYPSHSECGASSCSATRAWCCEVRTNIAPPRTRACTTTVLSQRYLEPSLGFEPRSAPYRDAASPQCFEGKGCWQGESNARHPSYGGGGPPLTYTGIAKSSAETRALEPERPTGRRGALCTRAPSWTSHRSILADRNSCRPKNGQPTAHRAPLAGGQRQARRPCGHASVSSFAGDLADHLALRFLRRPVVSAVTLVLR